MQYVEVEDDWDLPPAERKKAQQEKGLHQQQQVPTKSRAAAGVVRETFIDDVLDGDDEWESVSPGDAGAVVSLPPPSNVKVKSAEFVKSSVTLEQCPKASYPEFAVIGRSNVGKSSLINMITGRKSLAMVSKTPGGFRHLLEHASGITLPSLLQNLYLQIKNSGMWALPASTSHACLACHTTVLNQPLASD